MNKIIRDNYTTLILFGVFVCFMPLWEHLSNKWLIEPILSKFAVNWATLILFIIITFMTLYSGYRAYQQRYIIGNRITGIAFLCLLVWGWYRFTTNTAYPLYKIDFLCYVDLITIICFICIGIRFIRKKSTIQERSNGFINDEPVSEEKDDKLNRWINAKDAAEKLIQTDTSKNAFSFGIVASWGVGKTSFMNMMKKHLADMKNHDLIIMDFNPWIYRKNSNLTQIFFDELSNKLAPFSSGLSRDIRNYADSLNVIDSAWTKIAIHTFLKVTDKSAVELYEELSANIKLIEKKIVVFIDDIDRLSCSELEEIFRLVRNTSNLPNIYFVLAYDKIYVVDRLSSLFADHSLSYTEKILQEEYALRALTNSQIRLALKKLFVSLSENKPHQQAQIDKLFESRLNITQYIKTLRDVKRYGNILRSHYNKLKDDINLYDLCVYEILRMRYPRVLKLIEEKQDGIFVADRHNKVVLYNDADHKNKNATDAAMDKFMFGDNRIDIKKYLTDNKEALLLNDSDILLLENIFDLLWGKYRKSEKHNINNSIYMNRYFYYSILDNEISESDIQSFFKLSFEDMKPILEEWAVNKSYYFVNHIEDRYNKEKRDIKMLLRIIFFFNSVTKKTAFQDSTITELIREMPMFYGKRTEYNDEDKKFIRELLTMNEDCLFAISYIKDLHNYPFDENFPISSEELVSIQTKLFLDYTQTTKNDLKSIINVYRYAGRYVIDSNGARVYFHEKEVQQGLKNICIERFEEFIPFTIKTAPFEIYNYKLSYLPEALWDSNQNYYEYVINTNDDSSKIITEYKRFLTGLKESEFEKTIRFDFKHISPNNNQ